MQINTLNNINQGPTWHMTLLEHQAELGSLKQKSPAVVVSYIRRFMHDYQSISSTDWSMVEANYGFSMDDQKMVCIIEAYAAGKLMRCQ